MKTKYILFALLFLVPSFVLGAMASKTIEKSRFDALKKYTQIIYTIEKNYVDDVKIKDIVNKSINGLLNNLDAHSSFLSAKENTEMKIKTDGEFGGLGIHISIKDGALTIVSPIDDTPAFHVGIEAGDIILRIEDKSTLSMTIDEAVKLMRGKPNTKIQITVIRKGETKPLIFNIVRAVIKIKSVYTKMIEDKKIKYIRVTSFDKKVVAGVRKALKNSKNLKGIVLDLRNNPGGLLNQAIGLVDLFVDSGIIVSQKGRNKRENQIFKAKSRGTFSDISLVVLINGGSASASEIVSGSLQDHKRAIIVGEKSFGKGSVQMILPINKTEALRLTIARYYLPNGRTIQAKGVEPDIIVKKGKVPGSDEPDFRLKEADLKKHLEGEIEKLDKQNGKKKKKAKKKKKKNKNILSKKDINNDIQLKIAIDTIKTLNIIKGR